MSIRREDKEFIQSLSILGALLGTCIGAFMVMHLSDRAHRRYAEESEQQQTHAALLKLSTAAVTPNNPIANKDVLEQVQQHISPDSQQAGPEKGFWLTLPRWKLWILSGGGGLAGAFSGFTAIRLTGMLGSLLIYHFLRLLYAGIRRYAPNSSAAQTLKPKPDENGSQVYQRNEQRILPVVVKLFFFLLLTLILLTVVVWYLTNL
jgi:ABC-type branched-subunit amino acid transport system permease subunit